MASVHIRITKNVEFKVDEHDTLSVERWSNNSKPLIEVKIGFLTSQLIDQMIENLNRLRPFAK